MATCIDECVSEWLHDHEHDAELPDSVTVCGYRPKFFALPTIDEMLAQLDTLYGSEHEDTVSTTAMRRALDEFEATMKDEYAVRQVEQQHSVEVPLRDWIKKNDPDSYDLSRFRVYIT